MTVCLPFSKIRFLTANPRTGYILLGFIMFIIIYCYQEFYYLNDIGTVLLAGFVFQNQPKEPSPWLDLRLSKLHNFRLFGE